MNRNIPNKMITNLKNCWDLIMFLKIRSRIIHPFSHKQGQYKEVNRIIYKIIRNYMQGIKLGHIWSLNNQNHQSIIQIFVKIIKYISIIQSKIYLHLFSLNL
jgi:hypothetical protein